MVPRCESSPSRRVASPTHPPPLPVALRPPLQRNHAGGGPRLPLTALSLIVRLRLSRVGDGPRLRRRVRARVGVGVHEGGVGARGGGGARDLDRDLRRGHAGGLGARRVRLRLEAAALRSTPPASLHPAAPHAAAAQRRKRVHAWRRRPLVAAAAVGLLSRAPPATPRPHRHHAAAAAVAVRRRRGRRPERRHVQRRQARDLAVAAEPRALRGALPPDQVGVAARGHAAEVHLGGLDVAARARKAAAVVRGERAQAAEAAAARGAWPAAALAAVPRPAAELRHLALTRRAARARIGGGGGGGGRERGEARGGGGGRAWADAGSRGPARRHDHQARHHAPRLARRSLPRLSGTARRAATHAAGRVGDRPQAELQPDAAAVGGGAGRGLGLGLIGAQREVAGIALGRTEYRAELAKGARRARLPHARLVAASGQPALISLHLHAAVAGGRAAGQVQRQAVCMRRCVARVVTRPAADFRGRGPARLVRRLPPASVHAPSLQAGLRLSCLARGPHALALHVTGEADGRLGGSLEVAEALGRAPLVDSRLEAAVGTLLHAAVPARTCGREVQLQPRYLRHH
eukprot:scaffold31059_cov70-Phaeocystis_antarctica.AAC.1